MKLLPYRYLFLLLLAIGLFGAAVARPADPAFKHITVEDGLAQSVTYTVYQDSYGFIWIATGSGLNRYDGQQMRIYRKIPGDSTTLSDDLVYAICEDHHQRIWIGTANGLNLLTVAAPQSGQPERESFVRFHHQPDDDASLSNDVIRSLYCDRQGMIWAGTNSGANRVDPAQITAAGQATFDRFTFQPEGPPSTGDNRITAITSDQQGAIWLGALGGGLFRLAATGGGYDSFRHNAQDANSLSSNFVITVYCDSRGKIWVGTYAGGLNCYEPDIGRFTVFKHDPARASSISDNRVYAVFEEQEGIYYVGTFGGGVNRFDSRNGVFESYRHEAVNPRSLSSDYTRDLFRDRSGNVWVATNAGVNVFDLKPRKFNLYRHDPHVENSLSDDHILSVYESRRNGQSVLWVGSNAGLDRLERATGKVTRYKIDHRNPRSGEGFVYSVIEDSRGTVWAGSFGGGLYRLDPPTGKLQQFKSRRGDSTSIGDNRIYDIVEDARQRLWIGTLNGLSLYLPEKKIFKTFRPVPGDSSSLAGSAVFVIRQTRDGNLWLGTDGGLNCFDPRTRTAARYLHDPGDSTTLRHHRVDSIFEDDDGTIWVGTTHGLSRLRLTDRASGKFTHFFASDGLPDNEINCIEADRQGNLWIATVRGLSRFNEAAPRGQQFRNYDVHDGLQGNEFTAGASFRGATGELFFGGVRGLTAFFPENVWDNPHEPPVVITAFRKFDKTVLDGRAILNADVIELNYADRFVSFDFAALDYTLPEKNRYAHMLEGFDEDWVHSGNRPFASYTNLDAGRYTFRVKAANNDGVWNEAGTAIDVVVHPPYWETWWFRLLLILGVAAVLGLLYNYRVSKLLELERIRTRIASDLHDDVGSSLTKIALYSDLIQSGTEPKQMAGMLEKIGTMSRELVVTMSDIVWSIDARNDTMEDLLDRMRDFASSVLSAQNIEYSFDFRHLDTHRKLPAGIRQNIYLIFKEAVTNVTKHAGAQKVHIRLVRNNGRLVMVIEDDGTGIQQQENGKRSGHGLRNMEMRALRIGGELTVENPGGARVTLVLDG